MAYQTLYRKYRPQRFAELVGQAHVHAALLHAVRDDRVGHAYLFSGPRGTGKTTTARLLAKALNCTNRGADGDPCGACESCVAIAEGTSLDVIEVDAASRSKVDEMRELLDRVADLQRGGGKKVYILDEVHMLSGSAEAALLKTLEEAPEHVVFVLATTDPLKVAPTIRSRTQHYEFTLYSVDELQTHLANVGRRKGWRRRPRRSRSWPAPAPVRCATPCRCSTRRSRTEHSTSSRWGRSSAAPRSNAASRSSARWPTKTSPARSSPSATCSPPVTSRVASPRTCSPPRATPSSSPRRAAG